MAQLVGCQPTNGKVISLIPIMVHACIAGLLPSQGAHERQMIDVSQIVIYLSFFLPSFLSLKKKNKKKTKTFTKKSDSEISIFQHRLRDLSSHSPC